MTKLNAISLFSGAGGMDVGFCAANINVIVANELNIDASNTYKANHQKSVLFCGDIANYLDAMKTYTGTPIVFGGPPCQGFSVAGKMDPCDERSKLIWRFLDAVEIIKPKIFVMENVKALGKLEKWSSVREKYFERTKNLGYTCKAFILNSADFGVPQKRERVFFIGTLEHTDFTKFLDNLEKEKTTPPSLRQLFSSLPAAGSDENPLTCVAKITLAANPVMRKSPYAGMIFNGMGRPLNLDSICTTLPASMGGNKTPIIDTLLLNDPNANDWVKEYHTALNNGTVKPEFKEAPSNLRRLTIKEAAAIQTFPDDYIFTGSKSSIYTQIGNAVPCKLAEAIAKSIIKSFI